MVLQRDDHRGQTVLRFTRADVAYLTGDAGTAALAEVARLALTDSSRLAEVAAVRSRYGDRAGVLVETTLLRRRAAAKFDGVDVSDWLFTDEALQQATAAVVARHRAGRLAGAVVHDATCSIGTELAVLDGIAAGLLGSDLDDVRLAMARHNLGPAIGLCRADALAPITGGRFGAEVVVLVDPARRSGGRRRFDPSDYRPPLDQILATYRDRVAVVKCAPGIDFEAVRRLGFDGEIEVVSADGSVREACLWPPALSGPAVRRRATILGRGGSVDESITDADPADCPTLAPGRWIVDPDGAVVRSGLVRQYGARHGLWQLDPDIAYLSGDRLPPGVRGFEILQQVPMREKTLRSTLAALGCGALEILVRGVDVDPDALRRRLRLAGSEQLAVVITRLGRGASARGTAFVCRPGRASGARR